MNRKLKSKLWAIRSALFSSFHYTLLLCEDSNTDVLKTACVDVRVIDSPVPGLAETFDLQDREIRRRFACGDKAFIAVKDKKLLGITWGHEGACFIRGAGLLLKLAPEDVYHYGTFVLPEARGSNVYGSITRKFFEYYFPAPRRRYWVLIEAGNDVMAHILARMGWRPAANLTCTRIGGMRAVMNSPCSEEENPKHLFGRKQLPGYAIL